MVQMRSFVQEFAMPVIHKSTIRRARQSEKRQARNRERRRDEAQAPEP